MQDYKDTKLHDLIKQTGLKKSYIAEQLGITPTTFWKKLSGQVRFTKAELYLVSISRLKNFCGNEKVKEQSSELFTRNIQ